MTQPVLTPEQIAIQLERAKGNNPQAHTGQKVSELLNWFQDVRRKAADEYQLAHPYLPHAGLVKNYQRNSHPLVTDSVAKAVQDAVKFATQPQPQVQEEVIPQTTDDGYEFAQSWRTGGKNQPRVVVPVEQPATTSTTTTTQAGTQKKATSGTKLKSANKVAKTATTSAKPAVVKPAPLPTPNTAPTTFTDGYATYHIPHGEFTHHNDVSNVRINPVAVDGDNGGLQHVAMNALYKPQNAPMSLGEMIAFASIMQGKKTFGGINDITATMQDADKMNAYAAQAAVGDQVRSLIAQGRTPEEARYEALSSYLSAQGNDRAAISVANPEFQKFADQRAGRTLDVLAGIGGDYTATPNALGYTPYGINNFSVGDGTMTVNGRTTTGIIPEAVQGAVYAAVTGKGDGALKQREYDQSRLKDQWEMEKYIAELELGGKKGGAVNYDAIDPYTKAYLTELGKRKAAAEVGAMNQTGVDLSGVNAAVGY